MAVLEQRDVAGGVRVLTLHRPPANAFDLELMAALSTSIHAATDDDGVRALVVTGGGAMFSAGLDFKAVTAAMAAGDDADERFAATMEQTFLDLWTSPKPTVAAIGGHAIAAGYIFALAADVRLVAAGVHRFGLNELTWGAGFPTVAIELARSVLGHRLQDVLLGGALFDADAGLANGSFAAALPGQALLAAACDHARRLGERPLAAYAHAKALVLAPYVERARAETPAIRERMRAATRSPETQRALARYLAALSGAAPAR
ncbi:MAG: enoyl-CoA hydratase/isomerase family protein [Nannocystaceae bacterium]